MSMRQQQEINRLTKRVDEVEQTIELLATEIKALKDSKPSKKAA